MSFAPPMMSFPPPQHGQTGQSAHHFCLFSTHTVACAHRHKGRAAVSGFSPDAVARHPVISHLYEIVYVYFAANSRALGRTETHNY